MISPAANDAGHRKTQMNTDEYKTVKMELEKSHMEMKELATKEHG